MPTLLDKMKFPPFFKSLTVGANSTDHPDQSIKSSAMTKSPKPTFSPISTPVMDKKPVRPQYSAALRTASYLSDHSACTQSSSDTWPALPVQDPIPIRPKLPTFLRSTSYRSERSCSSRATSRSRDMEKEVAHLKDCLEPVFLPGFDLDSAIYAPVSPSLDSGDEGLAFEDLACPSLRVVIIGTGFAGLSTAIACARQGFSVTVLERSSGRSAHGDSVLLGANATLLMHKWGIGEEMWKRASRGSYWILYDQQGREVHKEDLRAVAAQYGAPILQGKRSHFIGVCGTEARLLGVKIRYETEVTGYSDSSESPSVILAGGEIVRADVVVVCDGARSVSRTLLAEGNVPSTPRRRSGYSIFRAIINAEPIREDPICSHFLDGCIRFWLGLDSHVEIWPMDNGKQLAFTFTHPDVSHASSLSWRTVSSISAVLAELSDWDATLQACIKKFPKALNWTILEDSIHAGWVSNGGKIVFAGDAVHPLSPASFQGATQACEDGATIAQCLSLAGATPDSVPLALRAFELLRKERTEKAGRLGRKQQRIFHTFVKRAKGSPKPLDPSTPPSPVDFAPRPDILRPLSFQLFDFDPEKFAQDNFHKVVAQINRERLASTNQTGEQVKSRYFAESEGGFEETGIFV